VVIGSEPFILRAGQIEVALVPSIGGSVAWFRFRGTHLLRPLDDKGMAAGNVLATAMFPMCPYANRIADNAFEFGGRTWTVLPNNPPERFNVHGDGWRLRWEVIRYGESEALLRLVGGEPSAPYNYCAEQSFVLDPEGLTVRLTLENRGPEAMPFGFGLHPWFEREAGVVLRFRARTFYLEEPDHVAGDPITIPPELNFAQGRELPHGWRNNDYGGWDGAAEVRFSRRGIGLRISADPVFRHLMLYADRNKPFFCLEPQTNAAGAFNRPNGFSDPEEGIIILSPFERASGAVRIAPFQF